MRIDKVSLADCRVGTVLGITPFNYPVNLACHKIGPAIAAGNPIIIKPAEKTPLSSVILAEMVLEAGFPPQAFSMLNAWGPDTEMMVTDPRIAVISFTGSGSVGWMLKSKAGHKKVTLELGGNAGVIVHNDANLPDAASQAAAGAFANAGQNCISVQRLLIQRDVFEEFTDGFVEKCGGDESRRPARPRCRYRSYDQPARCGTGGKLGE